MNRIDVVTTDCDGSLTDGGIYVFSNGLQARKFSTFDGEGVKLLRESGVRVILISQSNATEIRKRAQWLDIPFYGGVYDKAKMLDTLLHPTLVQTAWVDDLDSVAYFGNDLNDLRAMESCGFVGCPKDAHYKVVEYCRRAAPAGYVSYRESGKGAFREFAEFVIDKNMADGASSQNII